MSEMMWEFSCVWGCAPGGQCVVFFLSAEHSGQRQDSMAKYYSDAEVAEVLLQILEDARDRRTYPNSGVDSVEYVGQGQFTVRLFLDELRWAARGE